MPNDGCTFHQGSTLTAHWRTTTDGGTCHGHQSFYRLCCNQPPSPPPAPPPPVAGARTLPLTACGFNDCQGYWSVGECSNSCGAATRVSVFLVTKNAHSGGQACPNAHGDTREEVCTHLSPCPEPPSSCLSGDGRIAAVAFDDGIRIYTYDHVQQRFSSDATIAFAPGEPHFGEACRFSADGHVLVVGSPKQPRFQSGGGAGKIRIYKHVSSKGVWELHNPILQDSEDDKFGDILDPRTCTTRRTTCFVWPRWITLRPVWLCSTWARLPTGSCTESGTLKATSSSTGCSCGTGSIRRTTGRSSSCSHRRQTTKLFGR